MHSVNTMFDSNLDGVEVAPEFKVEPAVVREPPKPVQSTVPVYMEDRVELILEASEQIPPTGQFFGIDGVGYILKPNMPAIVPTGLVDILNHAIMSVPVVDPATSQIVNYTDRLRFPYRLIRHVPKGTPIPQA